MKQSRFLKILLILSPKISIPYKPTANTMLEQQIFSFAFSAEMVFGFSACSSCYREIIIENLTDSSLVTPAESLR